MINWFRRNLVNIVVAVVVAVPICIMAHIERAERVYTPVVDYEEPIYLELETTVEPNEVEKVGYPGAVTWEDIELLARLIHAEAGDSRIADETLYYVGSVVINRVNSELYPDTLYEVIYQTEPCIQYACTVDGNIEKEPTERCYEIAEVLLRCGSILPEDVLYQSSFKQGSGVYSYQDDLYFCYY